MFSIKTVKTKSVSEFSLQEFKIMQNLQYFHLQKYGLKFQKGDVLSGAADSIGQTQDWARLPLWGKAARAVFASQNRTGRRMEPSFPVKASL